jgi:hypothetical protein
MDTGKGAHCIEVSLQLFKEVSSMPDRSGRVLQAYG